MGSSPTAPTMHKKVCTKCNKLLCVDEFPWKRKANNQRSSWCLECHRAYAREHYAQNKDAYKKRARLAKDKSKKLAKIFLVEYLFAHPCIDCGESDILVLQFDHMLSGNLHVSALNHSVETISKELEKCEVRCANCHMRRHMMESNSWRLDFI